MKIYSEESQWESDRRWLHAMGKRPGDEIPESPRRTCHHVREAEARQELLGVGRIAGRWLVMVGVAIAVFVVGAGEATRALLRGEKSAMTNLHGTLCLCRDLLWS